MPTLVFWNINENVTPQSIVTLARAWGADILVLAENKASVSDLLLALNDGAQRLYFPDPGYSTRLTIFTRFPTDARTLIRDSHGIAIRHYLLPLSDSLLMVAAHLPSKLWTNTEEQALATTRVAKYVREAEAAVGHSRTVIIGDLNMNPFETGVVGSEGLHAIMDRRIAARGSRAVSGERCPFFYNPMWGLFGDLNSRPPGTYFYDSGSEVNYYWNMFDQVLLRPALLAFMAPQPVTVVTELGGTSLLTPSGRPNRAAMSDHLPIVCHLYEVLENANGG